MLTKEREDEIVELVNQINDASEKYQLIHAIFAIEKMFQKKMQQNWQNEYNLIREQIKNTNNQDDLETLFEKARELNKESMHKVTIVVEYISNLEVGNARISTSENHNFQITLPKDMENIRNQDGTINVKALTDLRKLMAHELGHVVLHSGILNDVEVDDPNMGSEEEAEFFADKLLELRRINDEETHLKL